MFDILEKCYIKYFKKENDHYEKTHNNLVFIDAFINRYNYLENSLKITDSKDEVLIDFDIINDDERYCAVTCTVRLKEDSIVAEIDKVYNNSIFCATELVEMNDNYFEGFLNDFTCYNTKVSVIENKEKMELHGRMCPTFFDSHGIKNDSGESIPYSSNDYQKIIKEIELMHLLDEDIVREEYNFDNNIVDSYTVYLDHVNMSLDNFDKYIDVKFNSKRRKRGK